MLWSSYFTERLGPWCGLSDFIWKNNIKGLNINIVGMHIKDIMSSQYCKVYWECISQRGLSYVEPIFKGKAIIWPIIDGA